MLVADWGTTNLRIYAIDEAGNILDQCYGPQGIRTIAQGQYAAILQRVAKQLKSAAGPIYVCGMAGARGGWLEAPYCETPLTLKTLAENLSPLPDNVDGCLLPGAKTFSADGTSDVMRGEEIQVFGALSRLGGTDGLFCLPGTHSKWVRVQKGQIVAFATFLTGDLFQALSRTMLACEPATPHCPEAFEKGLFSAWRGNFGLLHQLFTGRTRLLDETLAPNQVTPFLSGLLIGQEILEAESFFDPAESLVIIGEESLCRNYQAGLAARGMESGTLDGGVATCLGVADLHRMLEQGR